MMLHRHFEAEKNKNANTPRLSDVTPYDAPDEFVSDVFPPDEPEVELGPDMENVAEELSEPKRRGRPRKTDTE